MKKNKDELKCGNKGITLVALVITIVIMLILAGVAIATVLEGEGFFSKIRKIAQIHQQTLESEAQQIQVLKNEIDGYLVEKEIDPTEKKAIPIINIEKGEIFKEIIKVEDESGDIFYIPEGFSISNESPIEIDDGVVITNENNTKQFVWIPVDATGLNRMYEQKENIRLTGVNTKTNLYSKLNIRSEDSSKYMSGLPNTLNTREPDVLSEIDTSEQNYKNILGYKNIEEMAKAFVSEYMQIYNSIRKYGGFFVGRFELTGSIDNPTIEKGKKVLSASGSLAKNWYNLKKACKNIISTNNLQTTMIYGNQWDEIMHWLIETEDKTEVQINQNSSDWGNYKDSIGEASELSGSKQNSGSNEAWQANNIYDLAGNYFEWTQEAFDSNKRVSRGGDSNISGSTYSAAARDSYYPDYSYSRYSTRAILYII